MQYSNTHMQVSKVQRLVTISVMSAIAFVLMLFDFPVLPAFPFLKIDVSDISVFITMFLLGTWAGIGVAALRSLLHLLTTGANPINLVGDVASVMASILYTLPIYYVFSKSLKSKAQTVWMRIAGVTSGTLMLTVFMSLANYFVLLPLYMKIGGIPAGTSFQQMILYGIVPFNLIKGIVVSLVFVIVYSHLLPWLEKRMHRTK